MKCIIVLSLALFAMVCCEELYSTENDDLDIEAVLKDSVQRQAFVDCFIDKSECKSPVSDFKKDLPEAIQQACAKCTPAQKHIFKRFLEVLKEKAPADYQAIKAKYDPENKYLTALEAAIANS